MCVCMHQKDIVGVPWTEMIANCDQPDMGALNQLGPSRISEDVLNH